MLTSKASEESFTSFNETLSRSTVRLPVSLNSPAVERLASIVQLNLAPTSPVKLLPLPKSRLEERFAAPSRIRVDIPSLKSKLPANQAAPLADFTTESPL